MPVGRASKLTPEVQKRICDAIRAGNYREAAAAYAGIDDSTFRRWLADERPDYRAFRAAVQEAEAAAEVRIVAQWQQQIPENWQAAKDFLARRYPERWAETHKVTQLVGKELERALDLLANNLPEAEYRRVLAILAAGDRPAQAGDDGADRAGS